MAEYVSGTLTDFTNTAIPGLFPQIIFSPSGPGIGSTTLLAAVPVVVTPDMGGAFGVPLQRTDTIRPVVWYEVKVLYLDAGNNFVRMDEIPGRLFVPPGGGAFGDLFESPWNPVLAWYGPDAPGGTPVYSTLWLDTDDGSLYQWSN